MKHQQTLKLTLSAIFVALIIIGTFIRIPVPMVPFTLQLAATTMAGLVLGPRLGASTVATYVALGLLGLPIFTEGGGLSYIFKPSFGYLVGFIFGAYLSGKIAAVERPSLKRLLVANFAGLAVVYLFGMVYFYLCSTFYLHNPVGLWPLFLYCFLVAVPGDAALCVVIALLAKRILPSMGRERWMRYDK